MNNIEPTTPRCFLFDSLFVVRFKLLSDLRVSQRPGPDQAKLVIDRATVDNFLVENTLVLGKLTRPLTLSDQSYRQERASSQQQ